MRPEYPRSLHEFRKLFADEAACRRYLARSRWPEGVRCPRCEYPEALELPTRLLWRCRACGYDTSVTAGTVLHRTRVPLTFISFSCTEDLHPERFFRVNIRSESERPPPAGVHGRQA